MNKNEILLESGTNELEVLTFMLGDQTFGVNVAKVQAIVGYDPAEVTNLPNTDDAMLGMLLYRDRTISLIDLSLALNIENKPTASRQIVIVMEFNKSINGFRVDGVNKIDRLSWDSFVPLEDFLSDSQVNIIGSIHIDETEVLIVDMENLISAYIPSLTFEEATSETLGHVEKAKREDINVYFAEDSLSIRKLVVRILKGAGYTNIMEFTNGQDAYESLTKVSNEKNMMDQNVSGFPDVVISDIEMPRMDGLTLCKKIKTELGMEQVPVVMFSSLINEQMVSKCESVGADSYVTKPEMNKLITLLDSVCIK